LIAKRKKIQRSTNAEALHYLCKYRIFWTNHWIDLLA